MKLILCLVYYSLTISFSYAINQPFLKLRRAESNFILETIPLMRGLQLTGEIEDVGQGGGNVYRIETEASGNIFTEDIEEFYQDALQAQGWERIGHFTYVFNEKYLEIIPQNKGGMLTVIFQFKIKEF